MEKQKTNEENVFFTASTITEAEEIKAVKNEICPELYY